MSKKTLKEDTQPFTPLNLDTPTPEPRNTRRTGEYEPVAPPRNQQENGGCGCWLPALLTAFIVTLLIGVGLFLPPVDLYNRLFGAQYAMLDSLNNAVTTNDGLTLVIDPADTGDGFGVALASVPMESFVAGNATNGAWISEALAAAPPYLSLQSPVYSINTTGSEPGAVTLSVNLPPNVGNRDILDLYSWNTDSREWEFVPSHSDGTSSLITTVADVPDHLALFQAEPPEGPTVLVSVDISHSLTPEVASLATIVSPAGLQPTLEGT
ncbi:MAG: hypothetical protein H7175_01935, partial [Burkholderiales bacterium]|nr:hypothetical protein [Anaerolineae bacterium]